MCQPRLPCRQTRPEGNDRARRRPGAAPPPRAAHRARAHPPAGGRARPTSTSRRSAGSRRASAGWRSITCPGLAAALGVTADELLGPVARVDPRVHAEPIHRDGLTMWPLTNRGPAGGLQAYKFVISAKRRTPPDRATGPRGPRLDVRARRPAAPPARRRRPDHRAGRGRRVLAPGPRTGSAPSTARSS